MKKILIVGAGGIGSWLISTLSDLQMKHQLKDTQITIIDDDTIDTKNLGYQNFKDSDIMDYKAEVMGLRYRCEHKVGRILSNTDLDGYDCIVSAVDNAKFRKLMFKFVFAEGHDPIYWIDLRSEGTSIAMFTKSKKHTLTQMLATLPVDDGTNGSCQRSFELENGIIQTGNRIIAAIGAQAVLNWHRGTPNNKEFTQNF